MGREENKVESYLKDRIEALGGRCIKMGSWKGISDRICLMPDGNHFFVETKAPIGGRSSKMQKRWKKWCRKNNHNAYTANSKTMVDAVLSVEGYKKWTRTKYLTR